MQLLRDNLTLWTSSDSGEPDAAAADAHKDEKAAEPEKAEEAKTDAAPATES